MGSKGFNKLNSILSGQNHIIIPDLQRDYCWGDTNNLAKNFTESLLRYSTKDNVLQHSIGIIYAYDFPKNYYYLCDGQQRVTTLMIILGVLNSFKKDLKINNLLVLNNGLSRLKYEVRTTTVHFYNDLLVEIFLKEGNSQNLNEITSQNWWRDEYENDPSIKSMIQACKEIYSVLKDDSFLRTRLADFILEKVGFVFFDLKLDQKTTDIKVREFGEKMYEIVNTRGNPMEPNEHIKPKLLSAFPESEQKERTEEWEKWQDFFWQNKLEKEASADKGFDDFLIWYLKIKKQSDTVKILVDLNKEDFNRLRNYFTGIIDLINTFCTSNKIQKLFHSIQEFKETTPINNNSVLNYLRMLNKTENLVQQNILLPLLSFIVNRSNNEESIYQFLRRLRKNYFDNQIKERNVNYVDWRHVLDVIEHSRMTNSDALTFTNSATLDFKNIANVPLNVSKWFNTEEQLKHKLKNINNNVNKNKIEEWEDHEEFKGDLSPLIRIIQLIKGKLSIDNEDDIDSVDFGENPFVTYEELQDCFALYQKFTRENNVEIYNRFNLVKLRFLLLPASSGDYLFGREESKNYFRQWIKEKLFIYQNWFYRLCYECWGKSDEEINDMLKNYNKNILAQYMPIEPEGNSEQFFLTQSSVNKFLQEFELQIFLENFIRPKTDPTGLNWRQRRHYNHWMGYLWFYYQILKHINQGEFMNFTEKQIIYDTFIQDEENTSFGKLGNQFLRPPRKSIFEFEIAQGLYRNITDQDDVNKFTQDIVQMLQIEFS
jgi:hypothetical protein